SRGFALPEPKGLLPRKPSLRAGRYGLVGSSTLAAAAAKRPLVPPRRGDTRDAVDPAARFPVPVRATGRPSLRAPGRRPGTRDPGRGVGAGRAGDALRAGEALRGRVLGHLVPAMQEGDPAPERALEGVRGQGAVPRRQRVRGDQRGVAL